MGAPIFFIHGAFADNQVWNDFIPYFKDAGFETYAHTLFPDLRNKIKNPDLPKLRLNDYIIQLSQAIDVITKKHGQKPIVIGHSMGGLLAQKLIELNLGCLGVFITPSPPKGCDVKSLVVLLTHLNIALKNNPNESYKVWEFGAKWGVLNQIPQAQKDKRNNEFIYESGAALNDLVNFAQDENKIGTIDETKFQVPTLTIGAKLDRGTLVITHRKTAKKYENYGGDYIEYPNAGHMIIYEATAPQLARDIIDWIKAKSAI
jgi:alpha-beta hydrolase superfamily lysophospholipase